MLLHYTKFFDLGRNNFLILNMFLKFNKMGLNMFLKFS